MERKTRISYQDVATACAALQRIGGGAAVTVRAVRARLGCGSMATVLRHVRSWKAGELPGPPDPARIRAELALGLAEGDLAEVKAREEAALDRADRAKTDALKAKLRAERLSDQVAELATELERAQAALTAMRDRAVAAETRLALVEPLLAALTGRRPANAP
ncbi:DNA-binding protein [Zavarzinia sp.]|uniref:DNA-binding protein n=1 Tax=Zavarzinia sp. TaxID=2027920 RepID=UPI003564FD9B